MSGELAGLLLVAVGMAAILGVAEALRLGPALPCEWTRKWVHAGSGLLAAAFPWIFASAWPVVALAAGYVALMVVSRGRGWLRSVHGVGPVRHGACFYPPAVALTFAFAGDHPAAYVPALLALALGDAAAALVGQACGSVQYRILGTTRSVEGSLAMALVVFACVHAALLQLAAVDPLTSALWALHAAVLATLVEAVAPAGSDNLLIPVVTAALLLDVGRRPPEPAALSFGLLTLATALALAHAHHTRDDRAEATLSPNGGLGAEELRLRRSVDGGSRRESIPALGPLGSVAPLLRPGPGTGDGLRPAAEPDRGRQ